jgi:hypothetical protein
LQPRWPKADAASVSAVTAAMHFRIDESMPARPAQRKASVRWAGSSVRAVAKATMSARSERRAGQLIPPANRHPVSNVDQRDDPSADWLSRLRHERADGVIPMSDNTPIHLQCDHSKAPNVDLRVTHAKQPRNAGRAVLIV